MLNLFTQYLHYKGFFNDLRISSIFAGILSFQKHQKDTKKVLKKLVKSMQYFGMFQNMIRGTGLYTQLVHT